MIGPIGSRRRDALAVSFASDDFRPLTSFLDRFRWRSNGCRPGSRLPLVRKRWNLVSRLQSYRLDRRTTLTHNNERCPTSWMPRAVARIDQRKHGLPQCAGASDFRITLEGIKGLGNQCYSRLTIDIPMRYQQRARTRQ